METIEATLSLLFFLLLATPFLKSTTYYENDAYIYAELHDVYNVAILKGGRPLSNEEVYAIAYPNHIPISVGGKDCLFSITRHSFVGGFALEERLCIEG